MSRSSSLAQWVLFSVLALGVGGCASLSSSLRVTSNLSDPTEAPDRPATQQQEAVQILLAAAGGSFQIAQKPSSQAGPRETEEIEEYDPWEPFNETMFEFNRTLDRWAIKPVAKGYNRIMPDPWQQAIDNGFNNIAFVPRFINCLLQGRFAGAGREIIRFVVNTSLGLGGLIDIAGREGIQKCRGDLGQTLGVWGVGPGPFLVLPLFPPLTVRDAIGFFADGAMDPLGYFIPFLTAQLPMKAGETINDRALNLELFQGFEETVVDFYSALRNAYLQRRLKLINDAKEDTSPLLPPYEE